MRKLIAAAAASVLAIAAAAPAGAECAVSGRVARRPAVVEVRAPGAAPFVVRVSGLAFSVVPPTARGGIAVARIDSAIAFEAAVIRLPPYHVARTTPDATGMAVLQRGAHVDEVYAQGYSARVTLGIGGALLPEVLVPCSALGFGDVALESRAADPPLREALAPVREELMLRAGPGEGEALRMLARVGVIFDSIGEQVGFRHVELAAPEGRVVGWLPARDLVRTDGVRRRSHRVSGPYCAATCVRDHALRAGDFEGKARIAGGARVFASPAAAPWGRVTRAVVLTVLRRKGERWARVLRAPNLEEDCEELEHAYIRAEDVDAVVD